MRYQNRLIIFIAILSLSYSIEGCGKYKKSLGATASHDIKTSTSSTPCGPEQKMKTYTPSFVYFNCGPVDDLEVTPDTVNQKGEALGNRPINRGMLSVRYTNMHNDSINYRENFGIMFMAVGHGGGEVNWQWMSYQNGGGAIQSRLVIQRFDGSCPGFCEHSDIIDDLQFLDTADIWQWDCEWETEAAHLTCAVTKVGYPNIRYVTMNDPMGVYHALGYLGVGNSAFNGHLPSYSGIVSDFKLTVFAE